MRDPKFLNESGSSQGKWHLNRFDYFEFYGFETELKIKIVAWITLIASVFALFNLSILTFPFILWCSYVAVRTLFILHKKICSFHGYLLYPTMLIDTFKRYEKQIDMGDFDSIATLEKDR